MVRVVKNTDYDYGPQQITNGRLKIGQLNLGNNRVACDESRQTLVQGDYSALLVQEPYSTAGNVKCFGMGTNHHNIGHQNDGERHMSGIIEVLQLTPHVLTQLCTSHITTAEIATSFGPLVLISGYFQ